MPPRATNPVERRAAPRHACHRTCLVRFDRVHFDGQPGSVCVRAQIVDVSAGGVGLLLRPHLPAGVALSVSPLGHDRPAMGGVRVVRSAPHGNSWHHGCVLPRQLTEDELQSWLR
jgi:PilZ domain